MYQGKRITGPTEIIENQDWGSVAFAPGAVYELHYTLNSVVWAATYNKKQAIQNWINRVEAENPYCEVTWWQVVQTDTRLLLQMQIKRRLHDVDAITSGAIISAPLIYIGVLGMGILMAGGLLVTALHQVSKIPAETVQAIKEASDNLRIIAVLAVGAIVLLKYDDIIKAMASTALK